MDEQEKAKIVVRALSDRNPRLNIKDGTSITMAWTQKWKEPWCDASPLKLHDDGFGPLWLFGEEYRPMMVIRAGSFEDAWGIMLDESNCIPLNEVPEAYGFSTQAELDAEVEKEAWPDLVDGYEYAPSGGFGESGIVSVSYNTWMHELKLEDLERHCIGIRVEVDE